MDVMGTLARHVLFPIQCRRERNNIPNYLRELGSSQWASREELEGLQFRRLVEILKHAGQHSGFWRNRFASVGFDPDRLVNIADLRILPTLTKRELQQHRFAMRAEGHPGGLLSDKTGGSTGEPVHFDMDERRYYYRHAVTYRHNAWTGLEIGVKSAYLWGHRGDVSAPSGRLQRLRIKYMDRAIVLDTSSLSIESMTAFRDRLLAFAPTVYVGYANAVYLYARFLQARGGRYHRPSSIITSAEFLAPEQREVIESVFGCKVHDRYGSRETSLIASECGHGPGMHLADESLLVEILRPDGGHCLPGERGRIVITDLLNYGMPLIRYEIRDTAEPVAGACACGRGLTRIKMAGGRVTDFLLAKDGRIVSGASLTIYLIANAVGVAQAQLVQETRDEILVKVVSGDGYGPDTATWILDELPRYFGRDMHFAVEEVSEIPLATSGKHRFSICKLDPTELF